jgi:hypothetical protein
VGRGQIPTSFASYGALAKHMRYAERHARKLGRSIFHAMVRFGPKLERKQMVLFRAVDIGAELFAMAATCARAMAEARKGNRGAIDLADVFCREAKLRVDTLFDHMFGPTDDRVYRVAQDVLKGQHAWLENGIIGLHEEGAVEQFEAAAEAEPVGA